MKNSTWYTAAAVFLTVIVGALILGKAYNYKYDFQNVIAVTGLGEQEFVSDLIVWKGGFSQTSIDLQEAYRALDRNRNTIRNYLLSKGVKEEEVIFSFVNVNKQTEPIYGANGNYAGQRFSGYQLYQDFKIESTDVAKIETLSREISELIANGIALESISPEYYYTKLSDLKLELITKATEDARMRAQAIAEKSGTKLGDLKEGRMGVFQITAANSNEEYSWGGSYNTASKNKKASITMRLEYHLK